MSGVSELLGTDLTGDANTIMDELSALKKNLKRMISRDSIARKANALMCRYDLLISSNCDVDDVRTYMEAYEAELIVLTQMSINAILDTNNTGADMMKRIYNAESVDEQYQARVDLGNYLCDMEDAIRNGVDTLDMEANHTDKEYDTVKRLALSSHARYKGERSKNESLTKDNTKLNKDLNNTKQERLKQAQEGGDTSDNRKSSGHSGGDASITMSSMEGGKALKKYNSAAPSIINYRFFNDGNEVNFNFGIKVYPEVVKDKTLQLLFQSNVKRNIIVALRRIATGKDNFLTEYILALDKMKSMAIIEKKGHVEGKGFAHTLSKVLVKDIFKRFTMHKNQILPWYGILLDSSDQAAIKRNTGIDLVKEPNIRSTKNAMNKLVLLSVAIMDSTREIIHTIKDGESTWDTRDIDEYAERSSKLTTRDMQQMIKLQGR